MCNILTDLDSALLVMAEIEGAWWLEEEMKLLELPDNDDSRREQHYSVAGALRQIKENRERRADSIRWAGEDGEDWTTWLPSAEEFEEDTCGHTIYGSDGFNRYHVRNNGTVVYSRGHGLTDLAKAEAAGIEISRY